MSKYTVRHYLMHLSEAYDARSSHDELELRTKAQLVEQMIVLQGLLRRADSFILTDCTDEKVKPNDPTS